ncbi:MAG: MarC family protein [Candidatus Omnitrophica bacterium]|nr:MarC family protein [Candidatus Omnitrophota bacterium]
MDIVMERFWLAFIPLFVAFDAPGLLPLYWVLSQGLPGPQRRQAVHNAVLVAFLVALAFLWVSGAVFRFMGIQMADVMIAGGVILFALMLSDLLHPEKALFGSLEAIGVVPLGVPLIVGPAVLTTVLLSRERYGLWPTVAALSCNILVTWVVLQGADRLMERIGRDGAKVISKVFSLVLAAFAVMLVRQGLAMVMSPAPVPSR